MKAPISKKAEALLKDPNSAKAIIDAIVEDRMSHYKIQCSCGKVMEQCRCIGQKAVTVEQDGCEDCKKATLKEDTYRKFADSFYDNKTQKIMLLDFDGTINNYQKFGKDECDLSGLEPLVDKNGVHAFDFIKSCIDNNIKVKIFTTRASNTFFKIALYDWLLKFGMPTSYAEKLIVTNVKGPHDYILDDRANFEGVYPTAEYVRNFKPWLKR